MSKDREPKKTGGMPAAAEIFAETLRKMNDRLATSPHDAILPPEFKEAQILRRHFVSREFGQTTPSQDPEPDQSTEEPIH